MVALDGFSDSRHDAAGGGQAHGGILTLVLARRVECVIGTRWRARTAGALAILIFSLLPSRALDAQMRRDTSSDWSMSASSEGERYLRVLAVAGLAPAMQWSIRPFSIAALDRIAPADSGHPWSGQLALRSTGRRWVAYLQPDVGAILNSTFPYGFNDGPVWAGRGFTIVGSGGLQGELGPFQFTIAPQAFWAQNAAFPLAPNGHTGSQRFGDANYFTIDLPQRFGAGGYARLDPGQSTVQLSLFRLTGGISTANEYWGPAAESPFLLGNNAAGFRHVFAGTDGPVALGPLRLNARLIAGRLDQSDYSYADAASSRRYISGLVVAGGIAALPGLEVGAGRLFENIWPDSGVGFGDIVKPLFQSLLLKKLQSQFGGLGFRPDNQIASVFARWALPASGFEVYGEYGREDNAYDIRDLIVEPDHDVTFMLGLSRVWKRSADRLLLLRGELINGSITDLTRVRTQTPPYVHSPIVQGHTQLGQILGAPSAFAGGGMMLGLDLYAPDGRTSVTWRRMMREPPLQPTSSRDVMHALTVDGLLFRRRVDLAPELTLVYNANRNGKPGAFNARVALATRAHW